ncbi:MAG: PP2C family protein-serine/threonine phosphatase [Planctomycetota bacterium]|nr:PP2C family protein-serine/threonine phosphatase [Planctomycetota bacterium]
MTQTFTQEFQHEYEAERSRWLRRRVLWYFGVSLLFAVIGVFVNTINIEGVEEVGSLILVDKLLKYSSLVIYITAIAIVWLRPMSRRGLLRLVFTVIVVGGSLTLILLAIAFRSLPIDEESIRSASPGEQSSAQTEPAGAGTDTAPPTEPEPAVAEAPAQEDESLAAPNGGRNQTTAIPAGMTADGFRTVMIGVSGIYTIFITHFFACLFLPWTPRESIAPIIPLWIVFVPIMAFFTEGSLALRALIIVSAPISVVPGLLICWWRHHRHRDKFHYRALRGVYSEMRQELTDARRIHEALFPAPIKDGAFRFDYRYQPMRLIGGDFLYAHRFPGVDPTAANEEPLSIVIIDVTGHGIPAALTVNRLHGELERLFAEEPDIAPGDVLTALNRYVHLTLAGHSVYATALCLRFDPVAGELRWASGGHPPAFLLTGDGRLERLDSTAFVLGACHGADFQPGETVSRFARGDALIAYTDGATEARDERGRMLCIDGMQALLATLPRDAKTRLADSLLERVDDHRFGAPADDTLIVEVRRPA